MDWINALTQVVCSVGFPILVTGFLLWERMNVTKEMTASVVELTKVIALLNDKLEKEDK